MEKKLFERILKIDEAISSLREERLTITEQLGGVNAVRGLKATHNQMGKKRGKYARSRKDM